MIVILDTETTGLDTKTCDIIEIATAPVGEKVRSLLLKPRNPIPQEVIDITGITNEMVENSPSLEEALPEVLEMLHLDENPTFVAHNAPYDMGILLNNLLRAGFVENDLPFMQKKNWLCTNRLSKIAYGEEPRCVSTKLSAMRDYLKLEVPDDAVAHRAGADVLTCMRLMEHFQLMYSELTLDELNELCWGLIQYHRFPFGKHKGKQLRHIPTDYFIWLFENIDSLKPDGDNFDQDLYTSIVDEIDRRVSTMT